MYAIRSYYVGESAEVEIGGPVRFRFAVGENEHVDIRTFTFDAAEDVDTAVGGSLDVQP